MGKKWSNRDAGFFMFGVFSMYFTSIISLLPLIESLREQRFLAATFWGFFPILICFFIFKVLEMRGKNVR